MSAERWSARPEILRPVSEWAGRELMVALSLTEQAADALLTRSLTLVQRLPGTLAALEAGALHPRPDCRRDPTGCGHDLADRPGLRPPGPTDGCRPSAELDHHRPYPAGPTSAANLAGYCTTDHRGKHQAPGWQHQPEPDGTLSVTIPTGLVAVTTPPPY